MIVHLLDISHPYLCLVGNVREKRIAVLFQAGEPAIRSQQRLSTETLKAENLRVALL